MASVAEAELQRLNAEIVGHLLTQCSPPRDLIARRERLRAAADLRSGPAATLTPAWASNRRLSA